MLLRFTKQLPLFAVSYLILVNSLLFSAWSLADELVHNSVSAVIKNPKDNRTYDSVTLDNGLQVIVASDPDTANAAAVLLVGVGGYQNPRSHLGLAHYLEHMLLLGTKKYPEANGFSQFVHTHSGFHVGITDLKDTAYLFSIPNEKFDEALDYFSEYFKSPLFSPEYSDKERSAVSAEWSGKRANDNVIKLQILGLTGNPQHPLSQFWIGNLDTLKEDSEGSLHDALLDFYQRYYSSNNMKLALVGNQSTEELKKLAKKYFSSIENKHIDHPRITLEGLPSDALHKHIYYRSNSALKQLILEFPASDNSGQWRFKPNNYVSKLLTASDEGSLQAYLRAKHLADKVEFNYDTRLYDNSGVYSILFELTEQGLKHQDQVIAATFSYLNLIRSQGVTENYFNELKSQLDINYKNEMKGDALSTAESLGRALFDQPLSDVLYGKYRLDGFNPESIHAVLDQLSLDKVRVVHVSQREKVTLPVPYYDGAYRVEKISEKELASWAASSKKVKLKLPPENTLLKATETDLHFVPLDKPLELVKVPGAQAWLMHSQHSNDKSGLLYLVINSDEGEKNVRNFIMGCLLNDIFAMKNEALQSRYLQVGVKVGIERTEQNSQYMFASGPTYLQPQLMHDLFNNFVSLSFSESDVAIVKGRFQSWIANGAAAAPVKQAMTALNNFMLRSRWDSDEILKASTTITLNDLKTYQKQILNKNFINVFAFGYYDEAMVNKVVNDAVAQLGVKRQAGELFKKEYTVPSVGTTFVTNETIPDNNSALLDVHFSAVQSFAKKADLMVINSLFYDAFYTELRTKGQLAYDVESWAMDFNRYPAFCMIIQSDNTGLGALKSRFDQFRADFFKTITSVDPAVIEQIKFSILTQLHQKPANINDESAWYFSDFIAGDFGFSTRDTLISAIKSSSKERIINTYREIVLDENSMNLVIQKRGKKFNNEDFATVKNAIEVKSINEFVEQVNATHKLAP